MIRKNLKAYFAAVEDHFNYPLVTQPICDPFDITLEAEHWAGPYKCAKGDKVILNFRSDAALAIDGIDYLKLNALVLSYKNELMVVPFDPFASTLKTRRITFDTLKTFLQDNIADLLGWEARIGQLDRLEELLLEICYEERCRQRAKELCIELPLVSPASSTAQHLAKIFDIPEELLGIEPPKPSLSFTITDYPVRDTVIGYPVVNEKENPHIPKDYAERVTPFVNGPLTVLTPQQASVMHKKYEEHLRSKINSGEAGSFAIEWAIKELDRLRKIIVDDVLNLEVCICSAIMSPEGVITRGHRHYDCIRTAGKKGLKVSSLAAYQGFMTSRNRFVDRVEGLRLQKAAGIPSFQGAYRDQLYSEDLY